MKKLMVPLLAVALITIALSPATSANSQAQTWYFTNEYYFGPQADDGTWHSDRIMLTVPPGENIKLKAIGSIENAAVTAWWYAEDPAVCDVAFNEGLWTVDLWYRNTFQSGMLDVDICGVKPDGTIETILASGSTLIEENSTVQYIQIVCLDNPNEAQTILEGDRLAVRFTYGGMCGADGMLIFYNAEDCPSSLTSPDTDPGYPNPELPTVILLSVGLVCFAGFGLKRWTNRLKHSQLA